MLEMTLSEKLICVNESAGSHTKISFDCIFGYQFLLFHPFNAEFLIVDSIWKIIFENDPLFIEAGKVECLT